MAQQIRRRFQKTINYDENNSVAEPLGRGMVYRELYLKLSGQIDEPLATNASLAVGMGDEWGVVKRIEVIANNTDVIRSFTGNELWWLNYFMFGVPPHITVTLGDVTTDDPGFISCLVLPFWTMRSLRPMDTALDARELSDLKVRITWGDVEDIIQTVTPSAWITEPSIEVHSLECFNVKGPFSQGRQYKIQKDIPATNPQFQVMLPVGPMYRGFLMNFTGLSAAVGQVDQQIDDPNVLNNFKIKSGTTVYADIPAVLLTQIDGNMRNSIIRPYDGGLAVVNAGLYDQLRRGDTANNVDAWYFYDHVTDGYMSEAIDTLGFSEFELELDVTLSALHAPFTTQLNLIPLQIIPVRG